MTWIYSSRSLQCFFPSTKIQYADYKFKNINRFYKRDMEMYKCNKSSLLDLIMNHKSSSKDSTIFSYDTF